MMNPLSRRKKVSNFNFFSLIYSEPLAIGMKSPAVIAHDEQPDLLPPSPHSAHLTRSCTPALACSIPACPVHLAMGPSALLSPTHCSSCLTCPGLPQSVPSVLPASPSAVSVLDQSPSISCPFQMTMILVTCLGGPPGEEMARPF